MVSRGSLQQFRHEEVLIGPDDGPPVHGHLTIRPGMWADVCPCLNCPQQISVKILRPKDLRDKVYHKVSDELCVLDKLVVIIPDNQNTGIWQQLWHKTIKRYFYRPEARLLGKNWSHWALYVDWTKTKEPKKQEFIKPNQTYTLDELEGKIVRTRSSQRRFPKRT